MKREKIIYINFPNFVKSLQLFDNNIYLLILLILLFTLITSCELLNLRNSYDNLRKFIRRDLSRPESYTSEEGCRLINFDLGRSYFRKKVASLKGTGNGKEKKEGDRWREQTSDGVIVARFLLRFGS